MAGARTGRKRAIITKKTPRRSGTHPASVSLCGQSGFYQKSLGPAVAGKSGSASIKRWWGASPNPRIFHWTESDGLRGRKPGGGACGKSPKPVEGLSERAGQARDKKFRMTNRRLKTDMRAERKTRLITKCFSMEGPRPKQPADDKVAGGRTEIQVLSNESNLGGRKV